MTEDDFHSDLLEIAPYSDSDFSGLIDRLASHPMTERVRTTYFKTLTPDEFGSLIRRISGSQDLQASLVAPIIEQMLTHSSSGFSVSGLENISRQKKYLFISNHRHILNDSALFTYALHKAGWDSPLICLGDNLLVNDWVKTVVKMNRGLIVKRGLSPRELLRWSKALSHTIRSSISTQRASVWIAQREGRAKDGNDLTQSGILKMLTLGQKGNFLDALLELNLVPVSISYELDPTDALKARELYLRSLQGSYSKGPQEDLLSMTLEIQGKKGKIHLHIGEPLQSAEILHVRTASQKEQVEEVVKILNEKIRAGYKLWQSHWDAHDLLKDDLDPSHPFWIYSDQQINRLRAPELHDPEARSEVLKVLLKMYSAPIKNPDSSTLSEG